MSLTIRCPVCDELLAPSHAGRNAHMKRVHGVSIVPDRLVPMDPMQKAAIMARVEDRLGAAIIAPSPARRCNECGSTTSEGYWFMDGTGICEPCVKVRSQSIS